MIVKGPHHFISWSWPLGSCVKWALSVIDLLTIWSKCAQLQSVHRKALVIVWPSINPEGESRPFEKSLSSRCGSSLPFLHCSQPYHDFFADRRSPLFAGAVSSLTLPLLLLRILLLWNLKILKILNFSDIDCVNVIVVSDCFRVLELRICTSQVLDLASLAARYVLGDNNYWTSLQWDWRYWRCQI